VTLRLRLNGRWTTLQFDRAGDSVRADIRLDGLPPEHREASILEVEKGIFSVLLDGRSYEARVEPGPAGLIVDVAGRRFDAEVDDPRRLRKRAGAPGREGRQSVAAPMPGKVVRLLVSPGDEVQAGQGLVVIEAMKMQNELKAPKAGRVAALPAREGAAVAPGDVLAIVE
jgi:biotin carboxyl carrier protein